MIQRNVNSCHSEGVDHIPVDHSGRIGSEDVSPIDPHSTKFARTLENISTLFDRLSVIDDALLSQAQNESAISSRSGTDTSRSRLEQVMNDIADGRSPSCPVGPSCSRRNSVFKRIRSGPEGDASLAGPDDVAAQRANLLQLELERARDQIMRLVDERGALQNDFGHGDRKRMRHTAELLTIVRKKCTSLETELRLSQEELRNCLKLNSSLRQRNMELLESSDGVRSENVKLKGRLNVLRSDNSRKADTIQAISKQQCAEISSARQSAREGESITAQLRQRIRTLQDELQQSVSDREKVTRDLEATKGVIEQLNGDLEQSRQATARLMDEGAKTKAKLDAMEARLKDRARDGGQHKQVIARVAPTSIGDETIAALVTQLADARADTASAKQDTKDALSQLDQLKAKLFTTINRERNLRAEVDRLRSADERAIVYERDHQSVHAELEAGRTVFLKKIQKMQKTINELNEKIFDLERRELKRAPVLVRSGSGTRSSSSAITVDVARQPVLEERVRNRPSPVQTRFDEPVQAQQEEPTDMVPQPKSKSPYPKYMKGLIDCWDTEPIKLNIDLN